LCVELLAVGQGDHRHHFSPPESIMVPRVGQNLKLNNGVCPVMFGALGSVVRG
jgi:hypothetical protein